MLYYSIEKNTSAISTTPNPSGSTPFASLGGQLSNDDHHKQLVCSNNPDKTLVIAPTLGHYSSLPLFHLVKLPTGELGTLGQFSPHFHNHPHQRHTHSYDTKPFTEANNPIAITPSVTSNSGSDTNCLGSVPINANVTYTQSKFLSHEHSSTLATIQEESESIRSGGGNSPQNNNINSSPLGGTSPAVHGCQSPAGCPSTTIIINDLSTMKSEMEMDSEDEISKYFKLTSEKGVEGNENGVQIDNNGDLVTNHRIGGDAAVLFRSSNAVPSSGSVKSEADRDNQMNEIEAGKPNPPPETVIIMDWNCASDSSSFYDVS